MLRRRALGDLLIDKTANGTCQPDKTLPMIADEVFRMMAGPGEVQLFTDLFAAFGLEDANQIVNEIRRATKGSG
jgi:hypothetical protein